MTRDGAGPVSYWTNADGLRIFYRDHPGGEGLAPLLCLHGLTRNSRDFDDFIALYAGKRRVIALDFRGRGNSERDPRPERYLPVTYAGDVIGLLDHLQIPSAIFVGTSLGGLVTMIVAAMQPQRIAGAILNDIGPTVEKEGLQRIAGYVGTAVSFRDWSEAGAYVAGINKHLPASKTDQDWVRMARRLCREEDGRILFDYDMRIADAFRAPPGPAVDMWPLYRQLARNPLLILRGEHSDLLSDATARAMVEQGADAQLVIVSGVGHAPELNEPEAIAAIDLYLERVRG